MQNNYYALAHEQAAGERAEVRAQIELLLARDAKLERLLDALKELIPATSASGEIHAAVPAMECRGDGSVLEIHAHIPDQPPAA